MVRIIPVGTADEAFRILRSLSSPPPLPPHSFAEFVKASERVQSAKIDALVAQFPFRLPKNYPRWRDICAAFEGAKQAEVDMPNTITVTSKTHVHLIASWIDFHAPVYCLRESLISELMLVDAATIPRLVPTQGDWMPPWPVALMVPPTGKLKTPSGESIVYLLVGWVHPGLPDWVESKGVRQVFVTAMDTRGSVYYRSRCLDNGGLTEEILGEAGDVAMDEQERAWLTRLLLFVFQCSLATTVVPNIATDLPPELVNVPALKKAQRSFSPLIRSPRFLGESFDRIHAARCRGVSVGGGGKKRPHFRTWHMRAQRYGPKRQSVCVIWIPTVWVNGGGSKK